MDALEKIITGMEPQDALTRITKILERLLEDLDDDARDRFLMNLIEQYEGDKVASMVHL